jgi:hypothetical protein
MTRKATRPGLVAAMLGVSLGLGGGCEPEGGGGAPDPGKVPVSGDAVSSGTTMVGSRGSKATVIYEKAIEPGHTVQFWDFGRGTHAVREVLSVDQKQKRVMGDGQKITTLAALFAQLNPGTEQVPQAIVDADRRMAAAAAETGRPSPPPSAPATSGVSRSAAQSTALLADDDCSEDAFQDNWGEQWFKDQYCGGLPLQNWCATNWGHASTGEHRRNDHRWYQMEGDFNVPGHSHATIIRCHFITGCDPREDFGDQDVTPRTILYWHWSDQWLVGTASVVPTEALEPTTSCRGGCSCSG